MRAVGGVLAVCVTAAACSGPAPDDPARQSPQVSAHQPPQVSAGSHRVFVAFEPGRHDTLLVVDSVTGRVLHSTRAPGSDGYAASVRRHLWYLPVAGTANCQIAVDRVRIATARADSLRPTRIAVLDGGPVDSVSAQPALSADGSELAVVLDTGPTLSDSGAGPSCGSTDTIAVLDTRTHNVRYLAGQAGDQVDDLAWDHNELIARVTPFPHSATSVVEELNPATTASYTSGHVILDEPHGRLGPVFGFDGCLAVVTRGTIGCVRRGKIRLSHSLHPPSGLPSAVQRVSVARNGSALLLQTSDGATYWWRDNKLHRIPVTIRGRWDEPTW